MKLAVSLEDRLGHRFRDRSILERALTHRSRTHEAAGATRGDDYERMEFLGDALLGFIVSERLMGDDPRADEGTLTRRKQAVVNTTTLAEASQRLGLGEALLLGKGEAASGGRGKSSLLADAFESVLAAVYLDGGIRAARAFVRRHLKGELAATRGTSGQNSDTKTRLQELAQARLRVTPRYRIVASFGPAHARTFDAEVVFGDVTVGRGTGSSRKEAEREAARDALARIEGGFGEPADPHA